MKIIGYSSVNEDANSEIRALCMKKEDTLLCITGSGARVLDLLTQEVGKIVAIDINFAQNALLALKIAAIRVLNYDDFLSFLGITSSNKRLVIYGTLRKFLDLDVRLFWDRRLGIIKKGVIYQGNFEKHFRLMSHFINLTCPLLLKRLFNAKNIREQEKIFKKWIWKFLINISANRLMWKYILKDKGFYAYVPSSFSIPQYILGCLKKATSRFLFRESPFATLLFQGKFSLDFLPIHLRRENFTRIKENISKVSIVTDSLENFLSTQKEKKFNKFSLSDFSSYTSEDIYLSIWKDIERCSCENSIVCERQYLVKREISKDVFTRDADMEKSLEDSDTSIFYTFIIAKR